jgi:hypothetical protein
VTVIDDAGKEGVLKKCTITAGIRRYVLQTEVKGEKVDPAKVGQDFVEFREDNSTTLKDGILTLVPLSSVSLLEYDIENKSVQLTLALADSKTTKLKGTTRFVNINKFTVEGTIDLGDFGTATVKYQGGSINAKPGVKEFRLPFKQPVVQPTGPSYLITGIDEDKTVHKVRDLKALYRSGGVDRVSATLWFKKTAKIPLAKIAHLVQPEDSSDCEVKLDDGKQLPPLALVDNGFPDDGSAAQFVGLVGKVPTGYKIFPMQTFTELRREAE